MKIVPRVAPSDSDEELMARFCSGDRAAFDALFDRYAHDLRRYLRRLVADEAAADDLTQATFLSVVRGRGRLPGGTHVRPWLYAIATNAARDHFRRRKHEQLTPPEELRDVASEYSVDDARDPALSRVVRAAVLRLPRGEREVILLNRFEGLSMAEVALALGASVAAVKVRAHRAYAKLRGMLGSVWREEP